MLKTAAGRQPPATSPGPCPQQPTASREGSGRSASSQLIEFAIVCKVKFAFANNCNGVDMSHMTHRPSAIRALRPSPNLSLLLVGHRL